jgi:hypothetical protein
LVDTVSEIADLRIAYTVSGCQGYPRPPQARIEASVVRTRSSSRRSPGSEKRLACPEPGIRCLTKHRSGHGHAHELTRRIGDVPAWSGRAMTFLSTQAMAQGSPPGHRRNEVGSLPKRHVVIGALDARMPSPEVLGANRMDPAHFVGPATYPRKRGQD